MDKLNGHNRKLNQNGNTCNTHFNDDIIIIAGDPVISEKMKNFMRAHLDIEEVKTDPSLDKIRNEVAGMISDRKSVENDQNRENVKFISESIRKSEETKLKKEIKEIKFETGKTDINKVTAEWVEEWHRKKQMQGSISQSEEERKNFISGSLKLDSVEPASLMPDKKTRNRSFFIKYVSLAAAAITGALIIIRTFMPASDPEKIFNSYYEPYSAVSPVTRGDNNNIADIYTSAIKNYRSGNFNDAAAGFNLSLQKDPSFGSPNFFLGLTDLATGKYTDAIDRLRTVLNETGEYGKEAKWYLGLAYLKTGDDIKAAECFENLSGSEGYYKESADKILRRLK